MCRFIQIFKNPLYCIECLHYISQLQNCYLKYYKYLQDDFAPQDICSLIGAVTPFFWLILNSENEFMGFVFLDNFIGSKNILYSAELTTCFDKKAWGNFTRYSADFFLKKCFEEFGFYKIKAQIYPDNNRVKQLLKYSGFQYEGKLIKETMRNGIPQDIEIYGLYRDKKLKR